jgi:cell division protein FtsB
MMANGGVEIVWDGPVNNGLTQPIRLPTGGQSLGQARLADTDIDTMFAKWAKNSRFEVTITGESDLTQAFKEIDDGKKQIAEAKQDIKDLKQDVASIKKKSDNYVSKDGCRGLIQSELRVDNGPAQCVMRQTFQTQLQSHTKKATDDIEKLQKRMDSLSLEVKHLPSKKEGPHGQPVRAQQSAAAPVQPSNDKRVAAMEDDNLKVRETNTSAPLPELANPVLTVGSFGNSLPSSATA